MYTKMLTFVICVVVSVCQQIRDARLKKDGGMICRQALSQGSASDKAVSGPDIGLKEDIENKTRISGCTDNDTKFSLTHHAPSEPASERMWEEISDASETSEFSSSYSDLSPQPATATVKVVGNGLIQVTPMDPIPRRLSLGSNEGKMSMGTNWKNGERLYKHRCLWDSCDAAISEHEWEQSAEDINDDNGHPHHLVQLQNILPLFIFDVNNDGSRSVQLAVIGDHKLNSEYLLSPRTVQSLSGTVSCTAEEINNLPRNNSLLPKSMSR